MQLVASRFYRNETALSDIDLIDSLAIPSYNLERITNALVESGLLVLSEEGTYLPGKPFDTTPLVEVLHAIREDSNHMPALAANSCFATSTQLIQNIESHLDQALEGKTIKSLIE